MTKVAEAHPPTANIDFTPSNETWPNVYGIEVAAQVRPEFPVRKTDITFEEPNSTTESMIVYSKAKEIPSALKFKARRPLLLPEDHLRKPREVFVVLQDWEGVVDTVGDETFLARLRDRSSNERHATEEAELPIADVSDDDRELLRPGAIFYLTVGRATRESGRQDRVGRLVFRRLPAWTPSTLERARRRMERLKRFLAPKN